MFIWKQSIYVPLLFFLSHACVSNQLKCFIHLNWPPFSFLFIETSSSNRPWFCLHTIFLDPLVSVRFHHILQFCLYSYVFSIYFSFPHYFHVSLFLSLFSFLPLRIRNSHFLYLFPFCFVSIPFSLSIAQSIWIVEVKPQKRRLHVLFYSPFHSVIPPPHPSLPSSSSTALFSIVFSLKWAILLFSTKTSSRNEFKHRTPR